MKILIYGKQGSGKTEFAKQINIGLNFKIVESETNNIQKYRKSEAINLIVISQEEPSLFEKLLFDVTIKINKNLW